MCICFYIVVHILFMSLVSMYASYSVNILRLRLFWRLFFDILFSCLKIWLSFSENGFGAWTYCRIVNLATLGGFFDLSGLVWFIHFIFSLCLHTEDAFNFIKLFIFICFSVFINNLFYSPKLLLGMIPILFHDIFESIFLGLNFFLLDLSIF